MEKHATALIHGTANRAPRATVEYVTDVTSSSPVCLMVSNDTTITETHLTCEEAKALADGLLAAIRCVTEPTAVVEAIELPVKLVEASPTKTTATKAPGA